MAQVVAATADQVNDRAASYEVARMVADYLDETSSWMAERLQPVGGVAVTIGLADEPATVGASSDLALAVDLLQYSIGTGPCLHALRTGEGLYVPDLAADDRWGDYGPRAATLGAACCISVPILVEDVPAAVFKAYATKVDGLTLQQRETAVSLAREIAGGIGLARHLSVQARALDDRVAAMNTRRSIDLALGILMERNGSNADDAFELMRRYSQRYNLKLHEVAKRITGAQDAAGPAPFVP